MIFEIKVLLIIMYILVNGIAINYSYYCMNQASNVWLSLGIAVGLMVLTVNSIVIRKVVTKLIQKEETTDEQ